MWDRLPDVVIGKVALDVEAGDTFAKSKIVSEVLNSEIYQYITVSQKESDTGTLKTVITRKGKPAISLKLYNIRFNLSSLWGQLPAKIENVIDVLYSDSIPAILVALLRLLKQALGLVTIKLDRHLEAVCIVIATLSHRNHPVSFQTIHKACKTLRQQTGRFPLIDRDQLRIILDDLVELNCIEGVEDKGYKSKEWVIL